MICYLGNDQRKKASEKSFDSVATPASDWVPGVLQKVVDEGVVDLAVGDENRVGPVGVDRVAEQCWVRDTVG